MIVKQFIRRMARNLGRFFRGDAATQRPRYSQARPALEALETRELMSANPAIGMNIERVADYSSAWMFTDAFKSSRPWMSRAYNTTTQTFVQSLNDTLPVKLDAHGWATGLSHSVNAQGQPIQQYLDTLMFDDLNGHYAGGTYTAQWEGTGTIRWAGDVQVTQTGLTADGKHFAKLLDTPGNLGIRLEITADSTSDPIHNIHVWMPDYNGQSFVGQVWQPGANFSPFHPLFLQRLSPFHTLRFMEDASINTSQITHWADRRSWDYATQMTWTNTFQNGMAPEYMVELANELHADVWVNIPHMAQNDYITNLAKMFHDQLNPNQKVYLEWSNEVWNSAPGFAANQWVKQQLALPQNKGVKFEQFVANENRNTFDLWSQVYAGQTNRLVRVVAGFEANPAYTAAVLSYMNGHFDAIAPAAYYGPTAAQKSKYTATTTVDQVIADTQASIPTYLNYLKAHKQMADKYSAQLGRHIALLTYEGGIDLQGNNQPYQTAFVAAGQDPRMYNLYQQFLTGAAQIGLELAMQYQFTGRQINTPSGVYGVLNYMDQPTAQAPKYRALLDAISGVLYATPNTTRAYVPAKP